MSSLRVSSTALTLLFVLSLFSVVHSTMAQESPEPLLTAIRVPSALVDTVLEPIQIVDTVAHAPRGLWSVGWYENRLSLDKPGGQIFYGLSQLWDGTPGVFLYLDQLQSGQNIVLTGSDGLNYSYEVSSVETFSLQAPLTDVLAAPGGSSYWLILLANTTFDPSQGPFSGTLVVRAIRPSESVPIAPVVSPEYSSGTDVCPGMDALPSQSVYSDKASLGLSTAESTGPRTVKEISQVLADLPGCDFVVREAITLADGNVLALIGPPGVVPLDTLTAPVDINNGVVLDPERAARFRYVLFVREGNAWGVYQPPTTGG